MTKQTLLMTGATGLVGSRFVEMYDSKYDVHNADLTTGVDITSRGSVAKFVSDYQADTLIHLAAFTNTAEAFKQQGDKTAICYRVNVEGTRNIAEVCRKNNIHLVHISTDFVFDGVRPPEGGYTETTPRSPIGWYGETKAMAEEEVENSGASATIVRISYPYRKSYELKPDIIKKILMGLESGNLYPQFSDTTITPTLIDDIALGLDKVQELKPQGIYHFVGSSILSPYALAQKVASAFGYDRQLVKEGSLSKYLKTNPLPFAKYAGMSNTKASQELGIKFATIDEGLAKIK